MLMQQSSRKEMIMVRQYEDKLASLREQFFYMIIRRVAELSSNVCWTFPAAAHGESENLAGLRTVVWRGTTQPSSQKCGAEMEAENNLCGLENVGAKGEGATVCWRRWRRGCACIFRRGISSHLSLCFL